MKNEKEVSKGCARFVKSVDAMTVKWAGNDPVRKAQLLEDKKAFENFSINN